MYNPFIFKLEPGKSDVLDKAKDNLILSSTINLPLVSLGFHHYIHRTKNAMSITNSFQSKNKLYYIAQTSEFRYDWDYMSYFKNHGQSEIKKYPRIHIFKRIILMIS